MIRDFLAFGVTDTRLKELTLERAESLCRAAEESKRQIKQLSKEADKREEVHVMKKDGKPLTPKPQGGKLRFNCSKCGTWHLPKRCPAFGKNCHTCNKKGHFSKFCPKRFPWHGVHEVFKRDTISGHQIDRQQNVNILDSQVSTVAFLTRQVVFLNPRYIEVCCCGRKANVPEL